MFRVGSGNKSTTSQTEQIIFAQEAQNAFAVDNYTTATKLFGDRSVTVRTHFQRNGVDVHSAFYVLLLNGHWGGPQPAPDGRARETNRLAERSKGSLGGRSLS